MLLTLRTNLKTDSKAIKDKQLLLLQSWKSKNYTGSNRESQILILPYKYYQQFNIGPINILHFGCTNIIFASCTYIITYIIP